MTDTGQRMFKSLKLAWIPRILSKGKQNWCTVPGHYLRKMRGLNFLLRFCIKNDEECLYCGQNDSIGQLQKRERTGKGYCCFPSARSRTKMFK